VYEAAANERELVVALEHFDTETAKGNPALPIKLWWRRSAGSPGTDGLNTKKTGF